MEYGSYAVEKIQQSAVVFADGAIDSLIEKIGDAQIVLLGEATHGTHEFYSIRSEITKKLIIEKGFNAMAIEGDWPDAYQVNLYITNKKYTNAQEALHSFDRFPLWMWQNVPMVDLVEWLKTHNQKNNHVNFYGLDLYSLYRSIDVVLEYLENVDPQAAQQAKKNYACLEQFKDNPQAYGYLLFSQLAKSCQQEVVDELKRLETLQWQLKEEKKASQEDVFYMMQNARVVKNSEEYYRSLFLNEVSNWNLRDSHMMDTVEEIISHYQKKGIAKPKIVIWAHNSHLGNSAATQMSAAGEFNIGHLVKEKYGKKSFSVGFTTYNGTVSAASEWHMPVERKHIRNALPNSYEDLFHHVGIEKFLLFLEDKTIVPHQLLERAIGVLYIPETERQSHYFYASLAYQFDAVIHIDRTTALEPLEKPTIWLTGEIPETYPSGL